MATRLRRSSQDYELLPRSSNDSFANLDGLGLDDRSVQKTWLGFPKWFRSRRRSNLKTSTAYTHLSGSRRRRRRLLRLLYWLLITLPYGLVILIFFVIVFLPSYTHRPAHYNELRDRSLRSTTPGRANIHNEKVFIAASIYEQDGFLTGGAWGKAVTDLVYLLGPENVYLSIYENDPDPVSKDSLADLGKKVKCKSPVQSGQCRTLTS